MTDKYEDLKSAALEATPGPWRRTVTRFNGITNSTHSMASFSSEGVLANANEKRDAIFIAEANPAVILSLLAELEEKDKSISSLIDLVTYAQEGRNRWEATAISNFEECERMSKRIKELEDEQTISINELSRIIVRETRLRREADAKLAKPVRLPPLPEYRHNDRQEVRAEKDGFISGVEESASALREQGFAVEGMSDAEV